MQKFLLTLLILVSQFFILSAQQSDTKIKKYHHYIGVQANELIRQIINLNNSNTSVNNPYLLTYSINNNKGWGINAGGGINYSSSADKLDPVNRVTEVNNIFYRFGLEKKFMLGEKFVATLGIDYTGESRIDKTNSISFTDFGSEVDSTISTNTNKNTGRGGGGCLKLFYHFTGKILLGTETSFYYLKEKQKSNQTIQNTRFDVFNGTSETSLVNSNSESENKSFSIIVPVALFLIVEF